MNEKPTPKPTPKYRVEVKRPDAELPYAQRFEHNKTDRDIAIASFMDQTPHDHVIEVRLLKGFRHGWPVRWRADRERNGHLEVIRRYDQLASGKRPPTAKQLAEAPKVER